MRIAAGVHPHNAYDLSDHLVAALGERLLDRRVSALGEIWLYYHYDLSPRVVHRVVFRTLILLAKAAGLPVVLLMREAHDDGFAILAEEGFPDAVTLLYCFHLDGFEVARWVEAPCFLAFRRLAPLPARLGSARTGPDSAGDLSALDTYSPYMTPEPPARSSVRAVLFFVY